MPRVKSDADRGFVGAWMRRQRVQRAWSPERVVEELAQYGQRVRADYYRQLEAGSGGKQPGPELMESLSQLYGSTPEPPPPPTVTGSDLATALRELVEEVRLSRLSSEKNADVLAQLLGVVLLGRLPQPGTEAEVGAPSEQGTR